MRWESLFNKSTLHFIFYKVFWFCATSLLLSPLNKKHPYSTLQYNQKSGIHLLHPSVPISANQLSFILKTEQVCLPSFYQGPFTQTIAAFQIYSGNDTQFRVSGLESRTEYAIRVASVRVPSPGIELDGVFSPPGIFSTSAGESGTSQSSGKDTKSVATTKLGIFQQVGIFNIFD